MEVGGAKNKGKYAVGNAGKERNEEGLKKVGHGRVQE